MPGLTGSLPGLGMGSFQKNATFLRSFAFFIKERLVLCVLIRFFIKECGVLCILLRSL